MTKIATDFASKLAVAFVAVAMVFAAFAPAAQAQSSEDLQQMINDLLAQVAQLQGQTTGGGDSVMNCSSFLSDLAQGTSNGEVMRLQQFLNMDQDTRVAAAGSVGSAGMETQYYGPATAAAVSKFQVKYRAEILSPLGLVNPTGYWGAGSRAKANALCSETVPTVPDTGGDEDGMEDEDEDEEEDDFSLSGSANLDKFEVDDAEDDDVEEGQDDAEIGMFTVEFENGDAEIGRMDIALLKSGETDTDSSEPWEAFDTISLWIDGDMIAEVDASDEDEYIDEDTGELRFSNLGLIAEEDEEIEIIVAASLQGNLDSAELGNWNLFASEMRFFDADGVATTEDNFDDIDDTLSTSKAAGFTVEVEGAGDEFDVRTSNDDPQATTLPLEDDENTEFVVFAFDFDADDSDSDIEVNSFTMGANLLSSTSAELDINDIIDDIRVLVDGDEVDTDDVTLSTTDLGSFNNQIEVDFDNEFYVDAGEEVTVEIEVEFKSLADEGSTIQLTLDGGDVDAEGADDVTTGGAATGDEHTLRTEGVILEMDEEEEAFSFKENTEASIDDDEGTFTMVYEVTAFEDDFYFNKTAARGSSATAGAVFTIEDTDGAATTTGTVSQSLSSSADTEGSRFVVREGETETFTLKVTFNPATGENGFYALQLGSVNFFDVQAAGTADSQNATPAQDYETDPYEI